MIVPAGAIFPPSTMLPVQKIQAALREGCHYDYDAQEWRQGHDHVHVSGMEDGFEIYFCGADLTSCEPYLTPAPSRVQLVVAGGTGGA